MNIIEIHLPEDPNLIEASKNLILEFASSTHLEPSERDRLGLTCGKILKLAINHLQEPQNHRPLNSVLNKNSQSRIVIKRQSEGIEVAVYSQGKPLYLGAESQYLLESDGIKFENLGRLGQKLVFRVGQFEEQLYKASQEYHLPVTETDIKFRIRDLKPGEEKELSQLFFDVYRYRYVNEYVYFPEKLKAMIQNNRLIPVVAENSAGKIIGHIGLVRWNDSPPVYEAALGVVDPSYNSSGLFSKIFDRVVQRMEQTAMQYCVYDFVTNHDFSQRMVNKYGFSDMALLLGNQVGTLQAKLEELGIGKDPKDMDRYSLLVAVGPRVKNPFGRELILPTNIGESFGFLLKELNLRWSPAPRFYPLTQEGSYRTKLQKEHHAVIFDLTTPGKKAVERIIDEWKGFLRDGYIYGAVDVPLKYPGLGQVYDLLSKNGFFMAGFLPYQFSDELCFRFQFLLPTKVNFEAIKLYTESGKKLLAVVKTNYERNRLL